MYFSALFNYTIKEDSVLHNSYTFCTTFNLNYFHHLLLNSCEFQIIKANVSNKFL